MAPEASIANALWMLNGEKTRLASLGLESTYFEWNLWVKLLMALGKSGARFKRKFLA